MPLSEIERTAISVFRSKLKEALGEQLLSIKLFGSKARGNDSTASDIDLLVVVSTDDWRAADVVYGVATDILIDLGVYVSPKVSSRRHYDALMRRHTPFSVNVMRDSVAV